MGKNIFITSTGTNIGKTYCTVEILKEMLHRKVLFNAYKPILSGFDIYNIKDSDSYKILKTNNKEPEIEDIKEISPWLFEKPIAPSIAAKKENKSLKYNDVLEWCLKKSDNNIINIFEGAGLTDSNFLSKRFIIKPNNNTGYYSPQDNKKYFLIRDNIFLLH